MKRFLLLFGLSVACATTLRADPAVRIGLDTRFGGVALDKNCWEDSAAVLFDIGLTAWDPDLVIGAWVGLGVQGATFLWEDPWGEIESDVAAVPFGASLLMRCPLGSGVSLRGEAGVRYVSMEVDDDYHDHHHHRRYNDDWDRYYHPDHYLDVDDTSIAVASLALEFDLEPFFLAFGGGYQFDLEKPDVKYLDRSIGEVDLSGAFFYLSAGCYF